jgi:hypothetical protein
MTLFKLLEDSFNNPLLLTFLSIWIAGWFMKNRTKIDNKIIPIIITALGILLGLFIIEFSLKGALVGLLISAIQMGGYDLTKSLKKFIKFIFKPLSKAQPEEDTIIVPPSPNDDPDVLPPDNPV